MANDRVTIRATDVIFGLGRIRASSYATMHHSGLGWRTENMPVSVNSGVIEWGGPIRV